MLVHLRRKKVSIVYGFKTNFGWSNTDYDVTLELKYMRRNIIDDYKVVISE